MSQPIALVTGGTRGLGRAICLHLKSQGYQVLAGYYQGMQEAQSFSKLYHIPILAWDVGDAEACQDAVGFWKERFGSIDVLVNNAGICDDALITDMTPEQWLSVINTNLSAIFYMSRAVLPDMYQKQGGRIINIGSVQGVRSTRGIANYSAAKAGVIGFTKALAHEVALYGITANVVAPGYIQEGLCAHFSQSLKDQIIKSIPLKRFGYAEEVAALVGFLASAQASFITGATLHVNGGQWM